MAFDMGDYKEVSERISDLFAKHPEASLRGTYETLTLADKTYIAYRAECYRTPDDPAPGVGTAWEEFPGKTPYTKGSELQNAETSAWGRAIVAVGASESKKVASANEVLSARSRQTAEAGNRGSGGSGRPHGAEKPAPQESASATSPARRQKLKSRAAALQADGVDVTDARKAAMLATIDKCDEDGLTQWDVLLLALERDLERPFAGAK